MLIVASHEAASRLPGRAEHDQSLAAAVSLLGLAAGWRSGLQGLALQRLGPPCSLLALLGRGGCWHGILLCGQQQLKQAAAGDRGAAAPHPPPLAENKSYSKL